MTENQERIGVFGGTFDPVHNAHIAMARAAAEGADLDQVLFMVAARPPHKSGGTAASEEDRYDMVEAALADEPRMAASRLELEREGPSYTADTLRELHARHPDAELFLIIGMDSLVDLPKWREPDVILKLAQLLVIPRPGDWSVPEVLDGHYEIIPFVETPVSSTEVRDRLAAGESLDGLVPTEVQQLIEERGIYDTYTPSREGG